MTEDSCRLSELGAHASEGVRDHVLLKEQLWFREYPELEEVGDALTVDLFTHPVQRRDIPQGGHRETVGERLRLDKKRLGAGSEDVEVRQLLQRLAGIVADFVAGVLDQ